MAYAYWKKCDFQIHTPRDPNWVGARPVGLGEPIHAENRDATADDVAASRVEWARVLVDQCVAKGLEVVAISDHHEMVMVPFVEREIAARVEADADFDLWCMPGMELTASGGVQCLILFDAGLSEDWRRQAQGKLGIEYADIDELSATAPRVTQLARNYADIGAELDQLEGLRGHYIVLPNVSQGGQHTVLTEGNHTDFRRMPYVGGYLDRGQTINTLRARNRQRLSGEDSTWSTREIYPLPTSDARSDDYSNLGSNDSWIKLAAPTAEAVRQAFLGYRSRIRIATPRTPSLFVKLVTISDTTILDDTELQTSAELNAVIGGRGSGKSSFLEYLSFGLGRSCHDVPREQFSGTDRMRGLIEDTFVSKNASVSLEIVQDGAIFIIERGPGNAYQPQITYPNGSKQAITSSELRALFPAVVYCQGELAEIGKQTGTKTKLADILQFVNLDYKRQDELLSRAVEAAKHETAGAIRTLTGHWALEAELRKKRATRDSIRQRVEALEKTLPTPPADDQAKIEYFERASEFEVKRVQASKHADQILEDLTQIETDQSNQRDLASTLTDDTSEIRDRYTALYDAFTISIGNLKQGIDTHRAELAEAEESWATNFDAGRQARDEALERLGEHTAVTDQIIQLREQLALANNEIGDLETELEARGEPAADLVGSLRALREVGETRSAQTVQWADEIELLSSGKIKAVVDPAGDLSDVTDAIETLSARTGSQSGTRSEKLTEALKTSAVWDWLDRLRSDCQALLHWKELGAAAGEDAPDCETVLDLLGDTPKIRDAIIELIDAARIIAISSAVPKPEITLFYCDGKREISFEKASEGQRAAALVFMLLEQEGGPLIIDQPEGDLDNAIITELTEKLHESKQMRQLFFASHNANIVVNGSSELVARLEVAEDGARYFECAGAIDQPEICKLIATTMEGGEKAFRDRQDKYGY